MQGVEAVAIFFLVILVWRLIYVKYGNIGFWQLAADQPDAAFEWMKGRSDWIVLRPDDPKVKQLKESAELVGPFKLAVPSIGGIVVIFAENKSIDESQKEFMESFGGSKEQTSFPWLSSFAMIYPIAAMLYAGSRGAPLLPTLGYGFANLGYLLIVAGILSGGFQALGLRYRIPTLIAAVAVWVAGMVLSNL
ncbi:MAG: hypothetical protein HY204_10225 [Nitrospirae bacterium]|nr:hypothetical protein [Nitrospirota bacterium]